MIPTLLKGDAGAKSLMIAFAELVDAGVVNYPRPLRDPQRMVMEIGVLQRLALLAENPPK